MIALFANTPLAEAAGWTVQILAGQGHLLSQFLSFSNRRVDRWGGSLENRAWLLLTLHGAVRGAVRPDFCVKPRNLECQRFRPALAPAAPAGYPATQPAGAGCTGASPAAAESPEPCWGLRPMVSLPGRSVFSTRHAACYRRPDAGLLTGGIRQRNAAQSLLDQDLRWPDHMALAIQPALASEWLGHTTEIGRWPLPWPGSRRRRRPSCCGMVDHWVASAPASAAASLRHRLWRCSTARSNCASCPAATSASGLQPPCRRHLITPTPRKTASCRSPLVLLIISLGSPAACRPLLHTAGRTAASAGENHCHWAARAPRWGCQERCGRVESPLAFQVGGRIARRSVDARQTVALACCSELDQRDLQQMVRRRSRLGAAESALANADSELACQRQLLAQQFTSAGHWEQAQLMHRQRLAQRDAASARLEQARATRRLRPATAPAVGRLMSAAKRAVVAAGQSRYDAGAGRET